jgi:hypothetical protein
MGLTFPTVPVIESGDEITASQIRAIADGFNARMRSGVADPTYRIQQYFLCMWRQIRTGAGNVIPANSEFLESYMHVPPSAGNYPEPFFNGEGGMNPGNVMIRFVAGLPSGLDQDETRINIDVSTPSTPRGIWELSKRQRGFYDPSTDTRNAPATQAADLYRAIVGANGYHGKAYGGFSLEGLNGSRVTRTDSRCIDRTGVNSFISEFRGTDAQRDPDTFDVETVAFDFQSFLTRQYQLAPNKGASGAAVYPSFEDTGATIAAGQIGSTHSIQSGFVLGGALLEAEKLTNTVEIEIRHGGNVLRTISLTPESQSSLQLFNLSTSNDVEFLLLNEAEFEDSNGRITCEISELEQSKPQVEDAYLIIRLATTTGSVLIGSTDTIGTEYTQSAEIGQSFLENGAIISAHQVPSQAQFGVNDNPVWDAARRHTREWVRVITRESLLGYSATSNKSTLYFKRYKLVAGDQFDMWDGLVDAIQDDPEQGEYSNEWLTFFQFKGFNNNEDSAWKPSNYSDFWSMSDRCQFAGAALESGFNSDYKNHFLSSTVPEAATGYRYVGTTNPTTGMGFDEQESFYRSCQIYQPDYEVESIESVNIGGVDAVKVQYKTRFKRSASAPATVDFNIGTWDQDQITADAYRTDENATMSYILHSQLGAAMQDRKWGDTATDANQSPIWQPGDTYATIYPHFFFTKLIPFPGSGSDGVYESGDARCIIDQFQQCETYLRCMCEGYIDGPGTVRFECDLNGSSLYDYTFEALCFEANQLTGISFLPRSTRPEDPNAYGVLPNTVMYAEQYNQLARAVNLLDKARVIIPFKLECKRYFFEGTKDVEADWSDVGCNVTPAALKAVWTGTGESADQLVNETEWEECPQDFSGLYSVESDVETNFNMDSCGSGTDFQIRTTATVTEFRFMPINNRIALAIPPQVLELLQGGSGGFLGVKTTQNTTFILTEEATSGASYDCGGTALFSGGVGYSAELVENDTEVCGLLVSGALDPGQPGESGHAIVRDNALDFCLLGYGQTISLVADPSNNSFFVQVPIV